jgi:hypothetical protein
VTAPFHNRALAAVVVLTLLLGVGTAAVATEVDADYGARPAPVGDGSRPIDRFQHDLEPGTTITDALQVFNFTDIPAVFDIYAADMVPSSNGGLAPAARETAVVAEGTWLSPRESTVEVGPRESATVEFDIEVPIEASIGEHRGVILVERHEAPGSGTFDLRTRVGLVVDIEVRQEIALAGTVGPMTVERDGGGVIFRVSLTNTGEASFATTGVIRIADAGNDEVARLSLAPAGRYVASGEEASFRAVWEEPPLFGRYEAVATLEARVGDRDPVVLDGRPVSFSIVPWTEIVIVVVALSLLAWALYRIRPRLARRARHRREERDLIRDFRRRRALEERRLEVGGRHRSRT